MLKEFGSLLKNALAVLVILGVLVFLLNYPRLHVYQQYLREPAPATRMRYELLSTDMDEAAVRQHFAGVPLTCIPESREVNGLGDRVCYAALSRADDNPALGLALFFNKGRLGTAIVQVPWWRHVGQRMRLVARYGEPRIRDDKLHWKLPNGLLVVNQSRALNPLQWSVVMWLPPNARRL